eukprot:CAMPEP_0174828802 /NCGR_PEP_ID=MMETSP1114-20130205/1542_1 /TAXON_ID=312471 /ORGANISM="Neobodo designis, Strain CCAP 1951/1" /LENGTH=217 /DNA_ID=CAMNT_0016062527 /DNA_START=285 /DNA_END=938 /DNA_ORIENTATION=-
MLTTDLAVAVPAVAVAMSELSAPATMVAPVEHGDIRAAFTPPPPPISETPSSPATVWSDGDRERPPTQGLVFGAVAAVAASLFVDPRRPPKTTGEDVVRETLVDLSDGGLLSGHILVCAVSLIHRVAAAHPRTVSAITIRRVIVAAAMLANKAEADEVFAFTHFVACSGLTPELLKATEAQLFERLSFDVSTTAPQFHRALAAIAMHLPDVDAVDVL